MTLLSILLGTILIVLYAMFGRKWLKDRDWRWSKWLFVKIEPFEIWAYKKSSTLLLARFEQYGGLLLTGLANSGGLDLSPIKAVLNEKWQWTVDFFPLAVSISGFIREQQRKDTVLPLDIVALPEVKAPEVQRAVEKVEQATAEVKTAVVIEKTTAAIAEQVAKADAAVADLNKPKE